MDEGAPAPSNPHGDEFAGLFPDAEPIFVIGAARSGTSIVGTAIRAGGELFGEHESFLFSTAYLLLTHSDGLWAEHGPILEEFARVGSEHPSSTRSLLRFSFQDLQRDVLRHFDRIARPAGTTRWVDKTPDIYMVHTAPILAKAYPRARFVYCLRSGVAVLDSRRRTHTDSTFESNCRDWATIEDDWHTVRPMLGARAIEVIQHDVERTPAAVATRLAKFLDLGPDGARRITAVFRERAIGRTHARPPGVVPDLETVDWTEAERATFVRLCGPAIRRRGFPM